jgi:hypothetical protein
MTNWNSFKNEWENELSDIKAILKFLHTYPKVLQNLELEDLIIDDELLNRQEDWYNLCKQYTGLEAEFFKSYWVPLNKNSLSYFVDMSSQHYSIFRMQFSISEPYDYFKTYMFENISDLLMIEDSNSDAVLIKENFKEFCFKMYFERKNRVKPSSN